MIGEPPSFVGAVNATLALALSGVAVPIVGAEGGPTGFTETSPDAGPAPMAFAARTLHAYVTPFVMPVTVMGLVVPLAWAVVAPVAVQTAAYVVIAEPPFDAGAVNAICACVFPAVAAPIVGAPGIVAGVTVALADAVELPRAFVAITLHEYCVPFVSPVTVSGLAVPVAVPLV